MRRWLLTPLVASLFILSFVESWAALLDAARAAGIPYPKPWPWMVDGFIVATALLVVEARRTGHQRGAWWPRLGLLGATALSTGIQAAWAPTTVVVGGVERSADWAWALHAWSPLAVLFSFECLVWLVFGQGPARPKPATPARPPVPARLRVWLGSWDQVGPVPAQPEAAQVVRLDSKRPNAPTAARPSGLTLAQRRRVEGWVAEGRTNKSQMARDLGLSDRAKKERLAPLVDQLAAQRNGDGGGS